MTVAVPPRRGDFRPGRHLARPPSWLCLAAPLGGIGFTILYTALGARRANYSPERQLISALGAGPNGTPLNVGFVVAGLLLATGMAGFGGSLRPPLGPARAAVVSALLALPALGLIVCGLFPMDADLAVHAAGAQIACGLPIITFAIVAVLLRHRHRGIAAWLTASAVLALIALLGYMFLSASNPSDFRSVAGGGTVGLWERVLAVILYLICYPSLGVIGANAGRDTDDGGRV